MPFLINQTAHEEFIKGVGTSKKSLDDYVGVKNPEYTFLYFGRKVYSLTASQFRKLFLAKVYIAILFSSISAPSLIIIKVDPKNETPG